MVGCTQSRAGAVVVAVVAVSVAATDVSGPQSGTWTLAGSPYALVGDVTVPPGQTLTIEPGVEVVAAGHYRITVDQATLHAVGSNTQPILFTATDTVVGWRGIRLETADDTTTIRFCTIEYARGIGAFPDVRGGALMVRNCSPRISNNEFRFNSSHNGNLNGCGGAICAETSSAVITNNLFVENSADSGGAIATVNYGTPVIRGHRIIDNIALSGGGGLYLGTRSSPLIENNLLLANNAGGWGGGGINSWTGFIFFSTSATIRQNVIIFNSASSGGGLYCRYDRAEITANTIAFNSATYGGGIHALNYPAQAPLVRGCVVWGNVATGEGPQIDLDESTGSAINVSYSNVENGWPGIGNIDAAPGFRDIDGPDDMLATEDDDLRLTPASPCIDAGDNTAVPADIETDFDGNPRFIEVPETPDTGNGTLPIVDMGAYESLGGGCLAVTSQEVVCHADGTTFTVNIEGLNACTGGTTQVTFTASGGAVGEEMCFTALVNDGGFCCSTEICVTIPDCTPAGLPSDLDGDGIVGMVDFLALLGAWGSCSDCGTPQACPADFDGDCSVGILDLLILLGNCERAVATSVATRNRSTGVN